MLKCNFTQSQQVQQHLESNIWEESYACILVKGYGLFQNRHAQNYNGKSIDV